MNIIRILPENVASQIAAGEIIDRPASVVRELIDNSIDAAADKIVIRIEKGGKGSIKVSDNGLGMSKHDLLLCVERHATSKLKEISDLFSIKSLGFRGEAIPSIASVSRMHITSCPRDQISGYKLKISGGKLTSMEETGSPQGTIVEVRDLFFNVPARQKFLRTIRTETDHIIDVVSRAVLPFSRIHFRLEHADKTILKLPASEKPLPRLSALLGRKVVESMSEAKVKGQDLKIRAYLASSDFSRSRGDRLFIYINGRNVRDRLVTRAVMEGYGQRLMKGRYPQAAVFIDIDPSKVDVNVHPTKQEVRFRDNHTLFETLAPAIEKVLARSFHSFSDRVVNREKSDFDQEVAGTFISEPTLEYSQTTQTLTVGDETEVVEQSMFREGPHIIGQLGNTYILCQVDDSLLIVDQHAAHERIVYEGLKKDLHNSRIEQQMLLMPYRLELSMKEAKKALKKRDQLYCLGIDLDHFGGDTFLLRSTPAILNNVKWDVFLSEVITELEEPGANDEIVMDRALIVMACHGAIRAGQHLSQEEMRHLLEQLERMELPTNCPHGRPIFKLFTSHDIQKMFKRIV